MAINLSYLHSILQEAFDTIIDSFVRDHIGIAENFLSVPLASHLRDNLTALFADKQLHHAGIGNDATQAHDQAIRGDQIYWLDRSHGDRYENDFFDLMDQFVLHLNATCYTGITGYEFHYARYDEGSFYKKHLDRFRSNSDRQFSMIMYLNPDWQQADGGELCIHQDGHQLNISPTGGKSVFFSSSTLEHEVLLTHKPRMSITGWLKVRQ